MPTESNLRQSFNQESGEESRSSRTSRSASGSGNVKKFVVVGFTVGFVVGIVVVVLINRGKACTDDQKKLGCSECSGSQTCTVCKEGYKVTKLADGSDVCGIPCAAGVDEKCTRCGEAATCTDCVAGYAIEDKQVDGKTIEVCQYQCNDMQQSCSKCSSPTECETCKDDYGLVSESGGTTCQYICRNEQKAMGCKTCDSALVCTECNNSKTFKLVEAAAAKMVECKFQCTVPGTEDVIGGDEPGGACDECLPPKSEQCAKCREGYKLNEETKKCEPSEVNGVMTNLREMYAFRAANGENYPYNGINMASAAGALSYVAEEVIKETCVQEGDQIGRHYGIDRIKRFKVKWWNPPLVALNDRRGHFMQFRQFDKAQCTWGTIREPENCQFTNLAEVCVPKECMDEFGKYGYAVGCIPRATEGKQNYPEPDGYGMDNEHQNYWYSFPGSCPSRNFMNKTADCKAVEPGGECDDPDGTPFCTYNLEFIDEVTLDYIAGHCTDSKTCLVPNSCEWEMNKNCDATEPDKRGFWCDLEDAEENKKRLKIFYEKAGITPEKLDECDGW